MASPVQLRIAATTGGVANPIVSTVETGGSILLSLLAIALPVLAIVLVVLFVIFFFRKAKKLGVKIFEKKSVIQTKQNT